LRRSGAESVSVFMVGLAWCRLTWEAIRDAPGQGNNYFGNFFFGDLEPVFRV